jgi:hypothetical protein
MEGAGIFDNDILVVDRAVKPRHNHVVVAVVDGDFTVKQLCTNAPGAHQAQSRQPDLCRHRPQGRADPGSLGGGHQQHQAVSRSDCPEQTESTVMYALVDGNNFYVS